MNGGPIDPATAGSGPILGIPGPGGVWQGMPWQRQISGLNSSRLLLMG